MAHADTEESSQILQAIKKAWRATIKRYSEHRINSERCLQAYLFLHLIRCLPTEYKIYVEATIRIPRDEDKASYKRIAIDTLICKDQTIYAAIEIKFSPKGQSRRIGVRKDLQSLSAIKNRRNSADRVKVEMPRYRNNDEELMSLAVHPTNKLVFAAFGKKEGKRLNKTDFWLAHRPISGRWSTQETLPRQLCIVLAHTDQTGGAAPIFFGPPFDRLQSLAKAVERSDA